MCVTWPLSLRENHRLRVFEKRVFRKIFWPKKEDVEGRIKFHNEKLHALNSSSYIIR
jgi:hypothetical protein